MMSQALNFTQMAAFQLQYLSSSTYIVSVPQEIKYFQRDLDRNI